jgi:hypothetical protein
VSEPVDQKKCIESFAPTAGDPKISSGLGRAGRRENVEARHFRRHAAGTVEILILTILPGNYLHHIGPSIKEHVSDPLPANLAFSIIDTF